MGEALTIEARHERGYPIVTVAGEIDIATATRLQERLSGLAASGRPLVADLDQVTFIDSAGVSALVGAAVHTTPLTTTQADILRDCQVTPPPRITALDPA